MRDGPWRRRDFRLLWAGGLVNDTGDWLLMVALPIYVLIKTGSGITTALLILAQVVPTALLGPLLGNLVDRWDLRRTVVATNLAQAITLLPLLAVTSDRTWPAFVVTVTQAVLTRVNNPANAALLVRVVPDRDLPAANSARAASENLARLVGSPLGGIVVAFGGLPAVVLIDGVSFLVIALATAAVRSETPALRRRTADAPADAGRSIAGLRVLRRIRPLPGLFVTLVIAQMTQGMFLVLFLAFVVQRLGGGEADVGIIRGMQAVGGIIGGLLLVRVASQARPATLIAVGFGGMALWGFVSWNLPALTTAIVVYAVLMALAGPFAVSCSVGITNAVQQFTPRPYLGLCVGTIEAAGAIGQGAGALAAGTFLGHVPLLWLLNIEAALYVVTAVVGGLAVRPSVCGSEDVGPPLSSLTQNEKLTN